MQRRTIWDQSCSSPLTSARPVRTPGTIAAAEYSPAGFCMFSRRSRPKVCRTAGGAGAFFILGGAARPTWFQLNVPTHCISAYYAQPGWFVPPAVGASHTLRSFFHRTLGPSWESPKLTCSLQVNRDYAKIDGMVLAMIPDRSHKAQAPPQLLPTSRWTAR